NRRVLGQLVGHENAHLVALGAFDRWSGALAVVSPRVGFHARGELADDGFGNEVKLLDTVFHPPWKRASIERYDRVVGSPVRRKERRLSAAHLLRCRLRQR